MSIHLHQSGHTTRRRTLRIASGGLLVVAALSAGGTTLLAAGAISDEPSSDNKFYACARPSGQLITGTLTFNRSGTCPVHGALVSWNQQGPPGPPGIASTLAIDFEAFPGADGKLGTPDDVAPPTGTTDLEPVLRLSDEYAAIGVVFAEASLFWGPAFGKDAGLGNYLLSGTTLDARFSRPVFGIDIESYSNWDAQLTAYDLEDRVLAVANLWHPISRPGPALGVLHVSTTLPIARFTVTEQSGDVNRILNLDRLILTTSPS